MANKEPRQTKIDVGDGAAIPSKKDRGLFNAWWISLIGAVACILWLCLSNPGTYWRLLKYLPDGIVVTFEVTILSIILALILGLFTGLGRLSKNKTINLIASTYVEVVRGIPLLVQLFYIYFALGQVFRHLPEPDQVYLFFENMPDFMPAVVAYVFDFLKNMPPLVAAITAMGVCYGAYMGEVFRAGIDSIDKGQTEAARSLGFNGAQTMFMVILPQAWRTILPPVGNEFIALLKDSSLVSILAVADLLRRGREFASETFFYFEAYTMVALIYLVITLILSKAVSNMENRTELLWSRLSPSSASRTSTSSSAPSWPWTTCPWTSPRARRWSSSAPRAPASPPCCGPSTAWRPSTRAASSSTARTPAPPTATSTPCAWSWAWSSRASTCSRTRPCSRT